jgi:fructosamine-3-kinase
VRNRIVQDRFRAELERALSEHLGTRVEVKGSRGLGGGCINNAGRLETSHGTFFFKSNDSALPAMFEREAEGLRELHRTGAIRVPEPIAASSGGAGFPPYLLTTFVGDGTRSHDFSERFGRQLAELHRSGTAPRFGFHHDNYIGSTPQQNGWMEDWVAFWRERRLGYQLRLAERNGHGGELQRLGGRLMDRLDEFLATPDEPPALLHGDLWGGNYLCAEDGEPALIDPAVYYGRREADLAMTMLFGGFDARFHAAYQEAWPLAEGSAERLEIYKLYHLLNHLNLFVGGYLGGCLGVLRRFGG